jgi:hypothetical protein
MGATTVLLASGKKLPENVIGVLADCGYTSAKAIIQKVIRDLKLPDKLLYPIVRLGALIYGGSKLNLVGAPTQLINVIIGTVVFFIAISVIFRNLKYLKPKPKVTAPAAGSTGKEAGMQ